MKKVFSIITIITMLLLFITNVGAASDNSVIEKNANSLVKLGILKGYEDGSLRLDNKIKRSEFITLIVKMMAYDKDTDLAGTKINFKDLNAKHWAYNNIRVALKYQLVAGYPDNTIAPDKDVTYAEALAVAIRALGYENTLSGKWPDNVINTGTKLGLNKNLDLKADHPLSRGEMAVIVYNSLTVNFATN